jgi:type II restriction/modification system DNA methylase subunit YeeA
METGGDFDLTKIAHFNGGLFDGRRALPLDAGDIGLLIAAGSLDWSLIDPSIFGTLFERFLDPEKRGQIGAHYTDAEKIMMIVNPVVVQPLREEWVAAKTKIEKLVEEAHLKTGQAYRNAVTKAEEARSQFLERLRKVTILDPACGSGNFLYLALQAVKDIELRANLECEAMGLEPRAPAIGPEIVKGIEINPLAAELARTTIWIGDIQWSLRNAIYGRPDPILRKLETIECRDAVLTRKPDGDFEEAKWPPSEFIVGNPPFLGGKLLRTELGDEIVDAVFRVYDGRVPQEADLVVYWFEKARAALKSKRSARIGLVATNSIRGGANRRVLDRIVQENRIFEAWSDEAWVIEGAAVRVSLICFSNDHDAAWLDGRPVSGINSDLTAGSLDLTKAQRLAESAEVASNGISKKGKFEVDGSVARAWITHEYNPNGKTNALVLAPWKNGKHVTRSPFADKWIINFSGLSEEEASEFEAPFEYVKEKVKPFRARSNSTLERRYWWRLARPASGLFSLLAGLERFIVTPEVSKYRVFVWFRRGVCPDKNLVAIARDDDTTFGIVHSRFHEAWALRLGTSLEDRPRYTCSTTFATFPFPDGLTPNIPAREYAKDRRAIAIALAAKRLDEKRNNWLYPPGLVRVEPEVVPGFPNRILPKDAQSAMILRQRTLTNLYNQHPQWLIDAHRDLDAAVASAYGWLADISEEDALTRLLELNMQRAGTAASAADEAKTMSQNEADHPARLVTSR